MSTSLSFSDLPALSGKLCWEDPVITLERALEVRAQDGPPVGGPPQLGPNQGFLGPLSGSGGGGNCG